MQRSPKAKSKGGQTIYYMYDLYVMIVSQTQQNGAPSNLFILTFQFDTRVVIETQISHISISAKLCAIEVAALSTCLDLLTFRVLSPTKSNPNSTEKPYSKSKLMTDNNAMGHKYCMYRYQLVVSIRHITFPM